MGQVGESFFFYKSNRYQAGLKPPKDYVAKLIKGYGLVSNVPPKFLGFLASVETIEGLFPKDPPEFLITNYDTFIPLLRKWLVHYDKACVKVFASLIFKPSFLEEYFRSDLSGT